LVKPDVDLAAVVRDALRRGIRLIIACGGDGTVESVASELLGSEATLGIIPSGTWNNLAFNLGIPMDISSAVALLREGKRIRVDIGIASCNGVKHPFLEVCSVGLFSALFPAADDVQHGKLARLGDLLAALVSSPQAELSIALDEGDEILTRGHVILISNMPYIGPHYQVETEGSFDDGYLNALVFSSQTTLEALGSAVQFASTFEEDARIQRCRVRQLNINSRPPLPVLADGISLGEGPLQISILPRALAVMSSGKPDLIRKKTGQDRMGDDLLPGFDMLSIQ